MNLGQSSFVSLPSAGITSMSHDTQLFNLFVINYFVAIVGMWVPQSGFGSQKTVWEPAFPLTIM